MRPPIGTPSWCSRLLRVWTTIWMLALPLIHIHPETDPHHGLSGHVHAAAVHSVFSPDLKGEFDHDRPRDAEHAIPPSESGSVSESPFSAEGYTELGFSVLGGSGDRKLVKPLPVLSFVFQPTAVVLSEPGAKMEDCPFVAAPVTLLVHETFTRPPPLPFV